MTKLGRRINHAEFAHRPGEGTMAVTLFEALGCTCEIVDAPPYGAYIVVSLDGSPHGLNDMFASQAEPEQLALEDAFAAALTGGESALGRGAERYRQMQRERPFRANHVGLRLPDVAELNAVIGRLQTLADGEFAGRLELGEVMERSIEEARATDSPVKQLWIWTDVISAGLSTLGQMIELQAYE